MAKQTHVTLVDDLDGTPADETVRFGLDGTAYEIELNAANAATFRDAIAPYIKAGRREAPVARRNTGKGSRPGAAWGRDDINEIRQWATDNGYQVHPVGRVSRAVIAAYDARNKG